MNEDKNSIRFPVAGILLILLQIARILSIFFTVPSVSVPQTSIALFFINFLVVLFAGVVLMLRQRNGLLAIALTLLALYMIYAGYNNFCNSLLLISRNIIHRPINFSMYSYVFILATWISFLILVFVMTLGKATKAVSWVKRLWLLPALLITFSMLLNPVVISILSGSNFMPAAYQILRGLCYALPYVLLCRWLAHPYKKSLAPAAVVKSGEPVSPLAAPQAPAAAFAAASISAPTPVPAGSPAASSAASVGSPAASAAAPVSYGACPHCGAPLEADSAFCTNCGASVGAPASAYTPSYAPAQSSAVGDAPSGGFTALGFFIPLVGLILYLVWKDETPLRAKSAGKGALIGIITWTALSILLYIIYFLFLAHLYGSMVHAF